jgi:phosphoglycerate dehydrogenase-like enzyme
LTRRLADANLSVGPTSSQPNECAQRQTTQVSVQVVSIETIGEEAPAPPEPMVRVLPARFMDPVHVDQIRSVDPAVDVVYEQRLIAPVSQRERGFYRPEVLAGQSARADTDWRRDETEDAEWLDLLRTADVLFDVDWQSSAAIPSQTPALRWIQTTAAGAAAFFGLIPGLRESSVQLVAAHDVHSAALADFALAAILGHAKQFDRLARAKARRRWEEFANADLALQRACVVGAGSIGAAVADRLRAVGMDVVGVATRGRNPAGTSFSAIVGVDELVAALTVADFVVVTLPATPRTHHLFDAAALSAMKPGGYLVNVGRGQVIDEAALVAALSSRHLGGAALDVFETEPLPPSSPLWALDNVTISPHSTALMPSAMQRIVDLLCENLRRDLRHQPLLHVVANDADY